jgi:D-serine deaminase-like pyridoxal phosphate-dependent protein
MDGAQGGPGGEEFLVNAGLCMCVRERRSPILEFDLDGGVLAIRKGGPERVPRNESGARAVGEWEPRRRAGFSLDGDRAKHQPPPSPA